MEETEILGSTIINDESSGYEIKVKLTNYNNKIIFFCILGRRMKLAKDLYI